MTAQRKTNTTQTPIEALFEAWKAKVDEVNRSDLDEAAVDTEADRISGFTAEAYGIQPETAEDVWRLAVIGLGGFIEMDDTIQGRFMKLAADKVGLPETYRF